MTQVVLSKFHRWNYFSRHNLDEKGGRGEYSRQRKNIYIKRSKEKVWQVQGTDSSYSGSSTVFTLRMGW